MSEVGTIGQIYEDRRTKKRGKLLERDEKYKTLLMESDDGKSFNITYGGFKSNWRKIDEEVPTIEQAMEEVEVPEEPVKVEKPKKESVKKEVNTSDKITFFGEYLQKVAQLAEKFNSGVVVCPSEKKFMVTLKVNNAKLFETYAKYKIGYYNTLVSTSLVESNSEIAKLCTIRKLNSEGINKNRVCLMLEPKNIDKFLAVMEKCIYTKLENDIAKEEDK